MKIDSISSDLIKIALYHNELVPGSVSEIWIDSEDLLEIKSNLPTNNNIDVHIQKLSKTISLLKDIRRKKYLEEILKSLKYQIDKYDKKVNLSDFYLNTLGISLNKVGESEIDEIEEKLKKLLSGKTLEEVIKQHSVNTSSINRVFKEFIQSVKKQLPANIISFPDKGFDLQLVTNKPWSAFNSHLNPFYSKLEINRDINFTSLDLYRLASHEAYGGHHSELSQKDKLLVSEGRGEHGLVITFSPQTFVSEAIAEGIFVLLNLLDDSNVEQMVSWLHDRLIFVLYNKATYLFNDDGLTREQISTELKKHIISDKIREEILNFSTDPLFGKYAPIYYSSFNFINDLYSKTSKGAKLIDVLFHQPCTPTLLVEEFS